MISLLWKRMLLKIVGFVTKEAGEIIDFLHAENKILKSKIVGPIKLTDYDRMLLFKHGFPIKDRLHEFISIVKPETLLALSICFTNACCSRETKYNFVSWEHGIAE